MEYGDMDNVSFSCEPDSTVEIIENADEQRPTLLHYVHQRYQENYLQCAEMLANSLAEKARTRAELESARAQREDLKETLDNRSRLREAANKSYDNIMIELREVAARRHALLHRMKTGRQWKPPRMQISATKLQELRNRVEQMKMLLHIHTVPSPDMETPRGDDDDIQMATTDDVRDNNGGHDNYEMVRVEDGENSEDEIARTVGGDVENDMARTEEDDENEMARSDDDDDTARANDDNSDYNDNDSADDNDDVNGDNDYDNDYDDTDGGHDVDNYDVESDNDDYI